MSWQYGLIRDLKNPECWIISSKFGVVLADKYPKAKHHYLVLPLANIPSIFHLDRCHLPLLNELYLLARKVVEVEAGGVPWEDFQVGFHAEPSLHRLHLHVISRDFVSPCMRTKKHWNSHTTELFVPFEKLCDQLEKEDCFSRLPKSVVENLLSKPLICNQCEFEPESLLDLKTHLFYHWHTKKKEREEQKILDKIAKMSLYNNPPLKNQAKKPRGHKPRGPRQRNGPRDPSNSASFLEKGNGFQEESSQKPNQSSVGDKVEPSAQPTESSFQSTNQQLHQNSNLQHSNQNSNQQHHAYFNKQKGQISYEQHPSTKKPQQSKFKLQQPNRNMHPNQVNPQKINQFKYQNRRNTNQYNKQNGLNPYQHEMSAQNPQQTSCNQANKRSNLVHDESTNFRNFKTSNHKSKSKNKNPAIKKNHPKSADNLQKHESDVPPPPSVSKPSDTS